MDFERLLKKYTDAPLSRQTVLHLLKEYKRPNDKISALVREDELQYVKRGLYVPGPRTDLPIPGLFLIANHLHGPSYVSLETAMSYWGFVPERVYEISSVTLKATKTYKTEVGRFTYRHLEAPYYTFGIQRVLLTENQAALVASPEKALCDKIVTTAGVSLRSVRQTLDFLTEDLRIEEEALLTLDIEAIASWISDAPKQSSLQMLIKTLQTL
ncbi:hypothetical protein G5B00_15140 [Parapedobacter sp. SGR-10]|uniref:type IV toxin-antitoxin system AbiEi family antitoxin domain-containing protein n=1 Tax=Parapedobacter sp. SGR-10 TaxID=2710879 RepID=UPI0013D7B954|nr:hypothetical protein [Parapedobacter sp. SGR-10]NGF57853.1 hypothetical protein [Parapedobacter sp. SGR-10]